LSDFWFMLLSQTESPSPGGVPESYRPYIFLAGIVVLTLVIMRSTIRRIRQSRQRSQKSVKERVQDLTAPQEMYSSIGNLMAELAELSRQINGQIDTRCAKLEILLKQADQTIGKLEQGNACRSNAVSGVSPIVSAAEKPILPVHGSTTVPRQSSLPPESSTLSHVEAAQRQEILDLAAKGMAPVSIAKVLNRPVGEIELILSLNGKKTPPL